jgi:diguanylate cyclase (GGDEF)-like protein/PAS domain S-box-containing protein
METADKTIRKEIDEQLKQNFKDLLETQRIAHIGTWRLNVATNQVVWSEELYKMYGFDSTLPPPDYTEHMKLFTPESWKLLSSSLEKTRTLGIPYELELNTITKDGKNGWMWVRGEAETDAEGNIIAIWGAAQDITERKKAEYELRQSEERFQLLFNKAPLGYQSLDSDGRFIEVNQQWLDTFGYIREEVIGRWFGDFLCPEYIEGFRKRFPIFKAQGFIHSEFEMLTKEGQCLYISFEGKVGYDSNGDFKQTHCMLQDITNQRKVEQALKVSEERYKYLFEYSGVGIGYYTPDGVVISFNKRALENLSGKLEDYVGKTLWELFPKEEADFYFERITKALSNDDPQEYEDYLLLKSKPIWFSSTFTKIINVAGEIIGIQIASLDISERKNAEEEIRKQNELFVSLLKLLPVGVFMVDAKEGKPLVVNDMGRALLGSGILPDANEQNLSEVYKAYKKDTMKQYPTTEMPIILGMKGINAHIDDMIIERTDGTKVLLEVFGTPVRDEKGIPWASLVTFMDITERKKAEAELIYLSYHDHLTGFYNRRYFEEELMRLDTLTNLPLSIIICDINGLKLINDSFGHNYGDILLIKAAKAIKNACWKKTTIARIGGDEFAVILPQTNAGETEQIADNIKRMASREEVENIELSISYGYDTKTDEQQKMVEVLANAENHMYRHKLYARTSTRSKTIDIIMNTLFEKSNRESQHSNRVSLICQSIAAKMNFDKDEVNKIGIAGLVHDIGKIGIDEKILNKSGKLDSDEWKQIEKHPEIGWRILSSANEFLELAQFVLNHHEKWDGSGYPNGLKGEEIPLEARIIAVADAYDAMTSKRSYRTEISQEDALTELKRCAGTQFDPEIVDVFVKKVIPHDIFS